LQQCAALAAHCASQRVHRSPQVPRPCVCNTGQRSQQAARVAGAARHRAPHVQGRPRHCRRQVRSLGSATAPTPPPSTAPLPSRY
jgi:hypothetical protein